MLMPERPAGGFIRPYEHQLGLLTRAVDLFWVTLALLVGVQAVGRPWHDRYSLLAAIGCVAFLLAAEIVALYPASRGATLRTESTQVAAAWCAVVGATLFLGYAFKVTAFYSRLAVGFWFVLAPALLVAWRALVRTALRKLRSLGYNTRKVAIVGTGARGVEVARTVLAAPWMGLQLVGAYDDRDPVPGRVADDMPCTRLGKIEDLVESARRGVVDIIYVTLPISDKTRITGLVDTLSDTTVSLYFVPDMFLFTMFHGRWVQLGQLPAVSVFETPFYGSEGWLKRGTDLLVASLMLLVLAVPMVLIALAIKVTSPGSVLFRQRRYGLDGREFLMWKFRTMTVWEDEEEVRQAMREDPRVTRLGALLRRTSLDELPQLFNVLQGTMSIVGPRPHANAHNEHYRRLIRGYMVRHKVRPGITGWAQAHGWRGETETLDKMERRVEYDLWYIRNWSILLDLKIILLTLVRGWRGQKVY
jgi:putative colanic acid biosynthesis UDP-glucose lipid carrier transferase